MRRGAAGLLLMLLLLGGLPAGAKKKDKAPPEPAPREPGLYVEQLEGVLRIDAVLPGVLVGYALPDLGQGRRELFVLVRPQPEPEPEPEPQVAGESADRPGTLPPCPDAPADDGADRLLLLRIDPGGSGDLEQLRDDLPAETTAIDSLDLDGDGRDELLLFRDGRVDSLPIATKADGGTVGPGRLLIEDPDLRQGGPHPRLVRYPGLDLGAHWTVARLGRLDYYAPGDEGEAWGTRASLPVPTDARRDGPGFRVFSPVPWPVGLLPAGGLVLASPPRAHGDRRLQVLRLEPEAGADDRVIDCWCRLPGPEELLSSDFLMLGGRPALVATTRRADKLSLFGERRLRIWFLERDRSGAGLDPWFAVESRMNLWQEAHVSLTDANGDGEEDLVVGYWKGLVKSKVVLDAYLRLPDGTFEREPRTTAFDVKDGDEDVLLFGTDLDADGLSDLVLTASDELLVHRGRRSAKGAQIVDPRPAARISLRGASRSSPRLVDLDGDGRAEIFFSGTAGKEHGLVILRLE